AGLVKGLARPTRIPLRAPILDAPFIAPLVVTIPRSAFPGFRTPWRRMKLGPFLGSPVEHGKVLRVWDEAGKVETPVLTLGEGEQFLHLGRWPFYSQVAFAPIWHVPPCLKSRGSSPRRRCFVYLQFLNSSYVSLTSACRFEHGRQ